MKAITLWQPWATLMAGGVKVVETRSWPIPDNILQTIKDTGRPFPVLVHAGAAWNLDLMKQCCEPAFVAGLKRCGVNLEYTAATSNYFERKPRKDGKGTIKGRMGVRRVLPLGAIVGRVYLAGCVRTEKIIVDRVIKNVWSQRAPAGHVRMRPEQIPFGNFGPNRWAWFVAGTDALKKPLPWKGGQGIFDIPDEVLERELTQHSPGDPWTGARNPTP